MLRILSLSGFLFAFWLVLSGHYTPTFIVIGAVCSVACALLASRIHITDAEGHPVHLLLRATTYFPWLAWEIAKSAWSVTRIVLHPSLPISPTMTVVQAGQRTTPGIATYANSITLTPGTISVQVQGHAITVHALVRDGADDLEGGGMDRRVTRFEGSA
ncbi:MAG: Na+/H+ antiporter subunit E [Acetobacteraceae bacterium]